MEFKMYLCVRELVSSQAYCTFNRTVQIYCKSSITSK